MSDRAMVRRILRGDIAAGERLVSSSYPRVYRMLRGLTGDPDAADDLAQQTFAQAWQSLATFRGEATFATSLHRVAYRVYIHWLRDRRDFLPLDAAVQLPAALDRREVEGILVRQTIASLPLEQREVFVLYHVQQMSVSEVAELVDIPEGTVKSRLFAARKALRATLQAAGIGPAQAESAGPVSLEACNEV